MLAFSSYCDAYHRRGACRREIRREGDAALAIDASAWYEAEPGPYFQRWRRNQLCWHSRYSMACQHIEVFLAGLFLRRKRNGNNSCIMRNRNMAASRHRHHRRRARLQAFFLSAASPLSLVALQRWRRIIASSRIINIVSRRATAYRRNSASWLAALCAAWRMR